MSSRAMRGRRRGALLFLGLLLGVLLAFALLYLRSLLPYLVSFAALSVLLSLLLRPVALRAQAVWIQRQACPPQTFRVAHLSSRDEHDPWGILLAPYFAASIALFVGTIAAHFMHPPDYPQDYVTRAITASTILVAFVTPLCVPIWARRASGMRRVNVHNVLNEDVSDLPVLASFRPTAFLAHLGTILLAAFGAQPGWAEVWPAVLLANMALALTFVPPMLTALVYWAFFVDRDVALLRKLAGSRAVRSLRDL